MDAIHTLKTQHTDLEELFYEMSLAKDVSTRAEILDDLARKLIAHVALEERLLRQAVTSAPRASGLWEAWDGRLRVERIIMTLAGLDPRDEKFLAKVADLQNLVEDRIEYEEYHIFSKLEPFVGRARPGVAAPEARFTETEARFTEPEAARSAA